MEIDLINRKLLRSKYNDWLNELYSDIENNNYETAIGDTIKDCVYELDNQPTIDAIPVIRCKDCAYSYYYSATELACGYVDSLGNLKPRQKVEPNDFCSKGIDWRILQQKGINSNE